MGKLRIHDICVWNTKHHFVKRFYASALSQDEDSVFFFFFSDGIDFLYHSTSSV